MKHQKGEMVDHDGVAVEAARGGHMRNWGGGNGHSPDGRESVALPNEESAVADDTRGGEGEGVRDDRMAFAGTPRAGGSPALVCEIEPWVHAVRQQLGDGPLLCLNADFKVDFRSLMDEVGDRLIGCTLKEGDEVSGTRLGFKGWIVFAHQTGTIVALAGNVVRVYGRDMRCLRETVVAVRDRFAVTDRPAKTPPVFYVPEPGFGSLDFREVPMPKARAMGAARLALHYGEDFPAWEREFLKTLRRRTTGVSILRGEPGTGKTTFIRHLIAKLKRTHRFYFVPTAEIGMLVSAGALSSWVCERRLNSSGRIVVVLEDAGALVARRSDRDTGALAALLNISDGLLGQVLPIQVLCTVNLGITEMDAAILRPGRLLGYREFRLLRPAEAAALARAHGREFRADHDVSLAEVFANSALPVAAKSCQIGFGAAHGSGVDDAR